MSGLSQSFDDPTTQKHLKSASNRSGISCVPVLWLYSRCYYYLLEQASLPNHRSLDHDINACPKKHLGAFKIVSELLRLDVPGNSGGNTSQGIIHYFSAD